MSTPTDENISGNKKATVKKQAKHSDESSPLTIAIDVLRAIVLMVIIVLSLSYYTTAGESVLFGYRPWFTRPDVVKQYFSGELTLTPAQLSEYDGSNPSLPVYLALNGTIYDVSAGRQVYGPGGSYHFFAGRDSTRGYVTGCFAQDTTGDLRGVEEMFIPLDDPEDEREKAMTNAEKKIRRERDNREARKRVKQEVEKWEKFYANSEKYFKVGKLVGQETYTGEPPELCAEARKARPKRTMKVKDEL